MQVEIVHLATSRGASGNESHIYVRPFSMWIFQKLHSHCHSTPINAILHFLFVCAAAAALYAANEIRMHFFGFFFLRFSGHKIK